MKKTKILLFIHFDSFTSLYYIVLARFHMHKAIDDDDSHTAVHEKLSENSLRINYELNISRKSPLRKEIYIHNHRQSPREFCGKFEYSCSTFPTSLFVCIRTGDFKFKHFR